MSGRDGNGCTINDSETFRVNIQVPSIPPTDDITSNIIKVRYYCRVSETILSILCLNSLNIRFI